MKKITSIALLVLLIVAIKKMYKMRMFMAMKEDYDSGPCSMQKRY